MRLALLLALSPSSRVCADTPPRSVAECLELPAGKGCTVANFSEPPPDVRFQGEGRHASMPGALMAICNSDTVSWHVRKRHSWEITEPEDMAALAHVRFATHFTNLKRRPTFLDIGMNIGWHSLLFAAHGYNVIAVEAFAPNRAQMDVTLCLNPHLASRITVVPVAIGAPLEGNTICTRKQATHGGLAGKSAGSPSFVCSNKSSTPSGKGKQPDDFAPPSTLDSVLAKVAPHHIDVVKVRRNSLKLTRALCATLPINHMPRRATTTTDIANCMAG
jgi:FkbM family methyltransferase